MFGKIIFPAAEKDLPVFLAGSFQGVSVGDHLIMQDPRKRHDIIVVSRFLKTQAQVRIFEIGRSVTGVEAFHFVKYFFAHDDAGGGNKIDFTEIS